MDWIGLLVLEGLGIGMLAFAILVAIKRSFLISSGGVAVGIVVDHIKEAAEDDENAAYYRPLIEFNDRDGTVFHMKGRLAEYDRGQGIKVTKNIELCLPAHNTARITTLKKELIEVVYDRRNPINARVNSFHDLWLVPVVMSMAGVAAMVWGLFMFWLII